MQLYRWYSSYLGTFSNGDIVVMATCQTEAREKARAFFKAHVMAHVLCVDSYPEPDKYVPDSYDQVLLDEASQKFASDLLVDPEIMTTGVLFINGCELCQ